MKKPLNMIDMLYEALDVRRKCKLEEFLEKPKNLYSHFYADFDRVFKKVFEEQGKKYNSHVYYSLQDIIVQFMYADNALYRNEYTAYEKICIWAKRRPLSPDQTLENCQSFSKEKLGKLIAVFVKRRDLVDPVHYWDLVFMFCCFTILSEEAISESSYLFIKNWFEEGFDTFPKTWDDFKKEYKYAIK